MGKKLTPDIQKKLHLAVEDIESVSGVEVVVGVTSSCGRYAEGAYPWGAVGFLVAFTLAMYLPHTFTDEYMYFISVAGFGVGYAFGHYVAPVRRLFLSKKTLASNVRLHAEATFQRNHLHETEERIGILIFASLYEKTAVMILDKGAIGKLPQEDLDQMQAELSGIFSHSDPIERLLQLMNSWKPIFTQYIIRSEDDINELPNHIDIV